MLQRLSNGNGIRDWLLHIAEDNPIDLDIIERYGNFPSRKAAQMWANRLARSGNLSHVGTTKNSQGKKVVNVYCNRWTPKEDNLHHEVIGTRVRCLYPEFDVERGYGLPFDTDMVLKNNGRIFYVEIDCGNMKKHRVVARWNKYHKCNKDLLVVVSARDSEARMRSLMEWSDGIATIANFTTIERLETAGPHERIWDYLGRGDAVLRRVPHAVFTPIPTLAEGTPEIQQQQAITGGS